MQTFRYILDRSPKKYRCPACGRKTFVRFVDQKTGELMPGDCGRCDREQNCGYFAKPNGKNDESWQAPPAPPPNPISYIQPDVFRASLSGYENRYQDMKTIVSLPGCDQSSMKSRCKASSKRI